MTKEIILHSAKIGQIRQFGTIIELFSICNEVNLGKFKISSLLTLYQSAFIPRLISNCEAWSNLKAKDYHVLQKLPLTF